MARYDVTFACGHKLSVMLYGKVNYQKEQLKYIARCLCVDCKEKKPSRFDRSKMLIEPDASVKGYD